MQLARNCYCALSLISPDSKMFADHLDIHLFSEIANTAIGITLCGLQVTSVCKSTRGFGHISAAQGPDPQL